MIQALPDQVQRSLGDFLVELCRTHKVNQLKRSHAEDGHRQQCAKKPKIYPNKNGDLLPYALTRSELLNKQVAFATYRFNPFRVHRVITDLRTNTRHTNVN